MFTNNYVTDLTDYKLDSDCIKFVNHNERYKTQPKKDFD